MDRLFHQADPLKRGEEFAISLRKMKKAQILQQKRSRFFPAQELVGTKQKIHSKQLRAHAESICPQLIGQGSKVSLVTLR